MGRLGSRDVLSKTFCSDEMTSLETALIHKRKFDSKSRELMAYRKIDLVVCFTKNFLSISVSNQIKSNDKLEWTKYTVINLSYPIILV